MRSFHPQSYTANNIYNGGRGIGLRIYVRYYSYLADNKMFLLELQKKKCLTRI